MKRKQKIVEKDDCNEDNFAEQYITNPIVPAIAKNMHCGANFEFKTKAIYKGRVLEKTEVDRLYNLILDLTSH